LVDAGILPAEGVAPTLEQIVAATMQWEPLWAALEASLASTDRASFMREVEAALAAKPRRRHRRWQVRLGPAEIAYADVLQRLRRGLLRGDLTVDVLEALREAADTATAAPGRAEDAERAKAERVDAERAVAERVGATARSPQPPGVVTPSRPGSAPSRSPAVRSSRR
jgi:hypothetical protein